MRGRVRFEPGLQGDHKLMRGFEPTWAYSAHRVVRRFLEGERASILHQMPGWRQEAGLKDA